MLTGFVTLPPALPTPGPKCDLCGHDDAVLIGEKDISDIPITSGRMSFFVRLVCCKRCGLVFQYPLQDEEKLFAYYNYMFREEKCRPRHYMERQFSHRIPFAARFLDQAAAPTLLEVGCADGTTLQGFQRQGFRVLGIEPSQKMRHYAA